jgi:hypothetical protein
MSLLTYVQLCAKPPVRHVAPISPVSVNTRERALYRKDVFRGSEKSSGRFGKSLAFCATPSS